MASVSLGVCALLCLLPATMAQARVHRNPLGAPASEPLSAVSTSINDFGLDMYNAAFSEGRNVLVSPLSAHLVASMVHRGATGKTADEMAQVLRLPKNPVLLDKGNAALYNILSNPSNVTLELANRIYVDRSKNLRPEYVRSEKERHGAETMAADFMRYPEESRYYINSWVAEKTHNTIQNLLPSGVITPETRLVLVNAVYFNATWKEIFDSGLTQTRNFFVSKDKTKIAQMMQMTEVMPYAEIPELDAKAVELCYENKKACMQIILPNRKDGLSALNQRLAARTVDLNNIPFRPTLVQLALPKFKIDQAINMKALFQKMGIRRVFTNDAELSNMVENESLMVSEAVQKTFMDVNEDGTEASAASALGAVYLSFKTPSESETKMRVDHPFFIRLRWGPVTMFIGSVTDVSYPV